MPQETKTLIMKFGGASVENPERFSDLADLIVARKSYYSRIVVVVSAMRGMTDQLISLAEQVNPTPPRREYDMLVSVGERISISLMAMALSAKRVQAISFTGSQSGIITTEDHSEARIIAVRPIRLIPHLEERRVVIVAGFQGVSEGNKEITTLGRGGSDTSAVALGIALGAEKVEFFKNVSGIFEDDPLHHINPFLYPELTYHEALRIVMQSGGRILHPRAILLAQKNHLPLHVRSFRELEGRGTLISESNLQPVNAQYEVYLPAHSA